MSLWNGEPWKIENNTVQNHICCDCGLAHLLRVDIISKKKVELRFYRNDYRTKQIRKKEGIKIRNKK